MTPQELRTSIYQMAFQGKLVCQLPEEGTAEQLYSTISAKYLSKKIAVPNVENEDELPFEIPDTWKWVHFNHIATSNLGKTLDKVKNTGELCPYLCSINVYWDGISLDKVKEARFEETEREKYLLQKGDLLVCEGGDVGRSAIWENDQVMYYQNALHRIRFFADIDPYFYKYLLECYKGMGIIDRYSKGVTIKHLVQNALYAMWIPLPPLAEQKRIVSKIEELLPLIDRYEAAWGKLDEFNKRFPVDMQKSILQAAIQGKLVPQFPEEGTGEDLFRQIQEEKQRLIKSGTIKKEKFLPEIADDEIPFDIPESWKWVRVSQIVTLNPKNDLDDDLNTAFIPMPCVMDGFRNQHTFEIKKWKDIKKGFTHFAEGDIGVAKITPCFQNRKSVIFSDLLNGYGAGTTELTVVRTIGETILPEYLLWFFKSEYFIANGVKSFTGTAGQQRIHKDYLAMCPIPLPPLAEQKRIVVKLEEILPLCERLK